MKGVIQFILLTFFILTLTGCNPVTCSDKVDGDALLKSLSDPSTSLEMIAQNIFRLSSFCDITKHHQEIIDKAVEKLATKGSRELQFDFYKRMQELIPGSQIRLNFINYSSFFNDKLISSTDQDYILHVSSSDPVDLVDFRRKDPADNELKSKLMENGSVWKKNILTKAVRDVNVNFIPFYTNDYNEIYKKVTDVLNVASNNMENLKWLLGNPPNDSKLSNKFSSLDNKIEKIRSNLKGIAKPKEPEEPKKLDYIYGQATIELVREIEESENVIRLRPYVYLGYLYGVYPYKMVILSSPFNHFSGRGSNTHRLNVTMAKEPMKLKFQGFTQDFWNYIVTSRDEDLEYENHKREEYEYKNKLAEYPELLKNSIVELKEITFEIGKLKNDFYGVVEAAATIEIPDLQAKQSLKLSDQSPENKDAKLEGHDLDFKRAIVICPAEYTQERVNKTYMKGVDGSFIEEGKDAFEERKNNSTHWKQPRWMESVFNQGTVMPPGGRLYGLAANKPYGLCIEMDGNTYAFANGFQPHGAMNIAQALVNVKTGFVFLHSEINDVDMTTGNTSHEYELTTVAKGNSTSENEMFKRESNAIVKKISLN